jgi:phage gp36-like protein
MPTLGPFDYGITGRTVVGKVSTTDAITDVWTGSAFVAFDPDAPDDTGDTSLPETPAASGTYGPAALPAGLAAGTYWVSFWDVIAGVWYYRAGEWVTVGSPPPAATSAVLYTDANRVTRRVSTLGVELRTDADPGEGMAEALESAAADVEFYCGLRYAPDVLATSRWVQRVATDLAVYYLCLLRLGPVSKAVQEQADKARADLEKVKADVWAIPGIPQGRSSAPTVTNFSVNGRRYPATRVERPRSTGDARGYKRRVDYTADYLDQG